MLVVFEGLGNCGKTTIVKRLKEDYDVFIDFCGLKYEWCRLLLENLLRRPEMDGVSYWVSDRYRKNCDYREELIILKNSKIYVNCLDENEPDFDSCILHGYAYKRGKCILGYISSNILYYVAGLQKMRVNLMLEQPCNLLARNIDELSKAVQKFLSC